MEIDIEVKDSDFDWCKVKNNPDGNPICSIFIKGARRDVWLTEKEIYNIGRAIKQLKNKNGKSL